ncbi:hypothetical protein ACUXCC_005640, partial [Cytobacillus horneckiae]
MEKSDIRDLKFRAEYEDVFDTSIVKLLINEIEQQQQEIEQFKTVVKSLSFALEAYSGMPAEKAMNE